MALLEEEESSSFKFDQQRTFVDNRSCSIISEILPREDAPDTNEFMLHPTLDYINRILLEENIDEKFGGTGNEEAAALSRIEKPFYDIIGEKYPPVPNNQLAFDQPNSDHMLSTPLSNDLTKTESSVNDDFLRGVEEGMKCLPNINNLSANLQVGKLSLNATHKRNEKPSGTELKEDDVRRKAKKSPVDADLSLLDGRRSKMCALYTEETIRDEMFDKILLYDGEDDARHGVSCLRRVMKSEANPRVTSHQLLDSLIIECSEAVACNDHIATKNLITEIRKHVSPVGSGAQRFAYILADGLEARLAGIGSETYRRLVDRRISIREILKAYHMYITASPLLRVSYYFANEYIRKAAENASKIHLIDLGISFGFQWPPLIQALARRKGGAPKLRITAIDLPQPGFRPDERIKQIGVRLKEYAKSFNIPFEYQGIASLWECIRIEDLRIDDNEVLIVNSMLRNKNVRDDAFPESPRDHVLNLLRQIKPKVFILGILNASITPLFITRFRKVKSFYSMFFDMFDMLVPRDNEGRQILERKLLAPSIINLVACEGPDWVERPEPYTEWHKRVSRAGFEQLGMDQNIVRDCNEKVRSHCHDGFFIDEEGGWLLQGWKGRVIYGLSVWEPKLD